MCFWELISIVTDDMCINTNILQLRCTSPALPTTNRIMAVCCIRNVTSNLTVNHCFNVYDTYAECEAFDMSLGHNRRTDGIEWYSIMIQDKGILETDLNIENVHRDGFQS